MPPGRKWGDHWAHLICFPSLRGHSCVLPVVLYLKNSFFPYILSSFLVFFSVRTNIIPITLTIDFFLCLFVVVAMYSLKKLVCLASTGYHGLDFANYIPLV